MTDDMSTNQPASFFKSNTLSSSPHDKSQIHNDQHHDDDNYDAAGSHTPLRLHVERAVRQYIAEMGDELPTDLYQLILAEVEKPLLTVVFEQTCGNQSKCAQILGLNRGTLRKKLKTYALIS